MKFKPALWKEFIVFLVPMMLSNILQSLSGTINNIFVGQMIGVEALAAVSLSFPVFLFFYAFILGLSNGASMLMGQAYGAEEYQKVKVIAGTALMVAILFGGVVAAVGGIFTHNILIILGAPADILPEATLYAQVMLVGMPVQFVFLLFTSLLRVVGDAVTPLTAFIVSTALGVVGTPALINGWVGLPPLGIMSSAYATIFSMLITLVWIFIFLRKKAHPLAPDWILFRGFLVDWKILRVMLRIGIPTGAQTVIMALAGIALLSLVNKFGSDATAAYGSVMQVMTYAQFPTMSIAITVSIFSAQAIGAGKLYRLEKITRTGILLNLAITGGFVLFTYLFARSMIGLFVTSPVVVELALTLLRIALWSSVLLGIAGVLAGVMRASGTVFIPTAISMFAIVAIEVPFAYFMSKKIGVEGIWVAYPVAFTALLAMQTIYYRFVWMKKSVQKLI